MTGERKVKEVVYTIKGGGDSEISRTVRTERLPMSKERLRMILNYIAAYLGMILVFMFFFMMFYLFR